MSNYKQFLNEIKQIGELTYGDSQFNDQIGLKYKPHVEKKFEKARQIIKAGDVDNQYYVTFHGSRYKFNKFDPTKTDEFGFHFATSFHGTDWFTESLTSYLYVCQIPKKFKFLTTPDLGWHSWEQLFYWIGDQERDYIPDDLNKACIEFNKKLFFKNNSFEEAKKLFLKYYDGIYYQNQIETPYGLWVRSPCHERLNEIKLLRRIKLNWNKDKNDGSYSIEDVKEFDQRQQKNETPVENESK